MPTILLWHEQYWNNNRHTNTVTPDPPAAGATRGGYPLWQSGIVSIALIGPPLAMLKVWWAKVRWCWGAWRSLWRIARQPDRTGVRIWLDRWPEYTPQEWAVFGAVARLMKDPAWPLARLAVRQTATTLGFNEPAFWKDLSRALKENPGSAQNTFRHLHAVALTRGFVEDRPLTNPDLHLIVEAAYHAFAAEPKRTIK